MTRKFWLILGAGFCVLTTISAATGNFAIRFEAASQQSRQAQAAARSTPTPTTTQQQTQATARPTANRPSRIAVQRVTLTAAPVTRLGQAQPRSSVIRQSERFNIYFEAAGLSGRFQNGAVRGSITVDVLIRNAAGQTVLAQDNAWRVPVAQTATSNVALSTVFTNLTVNPLRLADGRYQIVLRMHDDLTNAFADRTLDIELRQNGTGQQVSQAQPVRR